MNAQHSFVGDSTMGRRKKLVGDQSMASRPCRLASASGGFAGCAALMIGILMCPTPAPAGTVLQTAVVQLPDGNQAANQMNVTVSSLEPIIVRQPNGDDVYAHTVLNGITGIGTLNMHACSGTTAAFIGGSAQGSGRLTYQASYVITSDTLPTGAPVFISLIANAARRETVALDFDVQFPLGLDVAAVSGSAQINFALPGATYAFSGFFDHSITPSFSSSGASTVMATHKSGLFDGLDAQQLLTVIGGTIHEGVVPAFVGDFVNIGVDASAIASSGVAFGNASADTQVLLNWGIHSFDSDIRIVSQIDGLPAPDNSDITLTTLFDPLPDRPPTLDMPDVPEPSTFIMLGPGIALILGIARSRRRRSRFKTME